MGSSNNATFDPDQWLKERLPLYKNVDFLAKLKRDTFALPARYLHRFLNSIQCLIDTLETPFPLSLILMIKDVIKARASASLPKRPMKTTSPEGFLKIIFHYKGIEKIDLSGILNQKFMLETVPPFIQKKESPCVVFKYAQPIGPFTSP